MSSQGATLQNYNNELVKCIEDLREKREELNKQIMKEEEDKGKIQKEREFVCLLRTQADRVEMVKTALSEIHPYDTPECLVLPVEAWLDAYLGWVRDETRDVDIPH